MPFAGYKDFDECVRKNSDKDDAKAYCATIMRKTEEKAGYELKMEDSVEKILADTMLEGLPSKDVVQKFCWSDVKSVDSVKVLGKTIVVNYTATFSDYENKQKDEKRRMEFDIVPKDSYANTDDVQKLFNSMINGSK